MTGGDHRAPVEITAHQWRSPCTNGAASRTAVCVLIMCTRVEITLRVQSVSKLIQGTLRMCPEVEMLSWGCILQLNYRYSALTRDEVGAYAHGMHVYVNSFLPRDWCFHTTITSNTVVRGCFAVHPWDCVFEWASHQEKYYEA